MTDRRAGGEGDTDDHARRVLLDLPPALWVETARAVRRALGRVSRAELPPAIRPFADWKPERLGSGRPRAVLSAALADDPLLRSAFAEELPDRLADAADQDVGRLVAEVGEPQAAVALVAHARWDDLAALASQSATRAAGAQRAAADDAADDDMRRERDRLAGELDAARREQRQLRDSLDAARRRADTAQEEREALQQRVRELEAEVSELAEQRRTQLRRSRDREQRLRRRAERAESRAELDPRELATAADQMATLAQRLRSAAGTPQLLTDQPGAPVVGESQGPLEPPAAPAPLEPPGPQPPLIPSVPRAVPAAEPGRPCRLPPGVRADAPEGVEALLKVPQITVLVDGYNVTKHPQGRPTTPLSAQRDWLVRLAGAVVARFRCRMVVVFDGSEPAASTGPSMRGVRVVFSEGEELADDRLIALLEGLDAAAPACVVSSDREVADEASARRADVVASSTFLTAVA